LASESENFWKNNYAAKWHVTCFNNLTEGAIKTTPGKFEMANGGTCF